MTAKSNRGGKRPGAGRPGNSGRYGEPTQAIRVPASLVSEIRSLLDRIANTQPEQRFVGVYRPAPQPTSMPLTLFATRVAAGLPTPADDYAERQLDLNRYLVKRPATTFYVRVSGDSMIDAGIYPDDILIVDRSLEPVHGKIVIAVVNGELTVKRLHIRAGALRLVPENQRHTPIEITDETDFSIWGIVTGAVHEF